MTDCLPSPPTPTPAMLLKIAARQIGEKSKVLLATGVWV